MCQVSYMVEPRVSGEALNELFSNAWDDHEPREFATILAHSLTYICAFQDAQLIGFVNVAWDGGIHGFILDTTVHRDWQGRGVGTEMMRHASNVASIRGIEWLHVDFEPHLEGFYRRCGFERTEAGLLHLR